MNKLQQREVTKTLAYGSELGIDYIARSLSALYRGAATSKQQAAILEVAKQHGATSSSEWVV